MSSYLFYHHCLAQKWWRGVGKILQWWVDSELLLIGWETARILLSHSSGGKTTNGGRLGGKIIWVHKRLNSESVCYWVQICLDDDFVIPLNRQLHWWRHWQANPGHDYWGWWPSVLPPWYHSPSKNQSCQVSCPLFGCSTHYSMAVRVYESWLG